VCDFVLLDFLSEHIVRGLLKCFDFPNRANLNMVNMEGVKIEFCEIINGS